MPDVSGIDKVFDYVVPQNLIDRASVGCRVRVDLHGRRVSGWVVSLGPHDPSTHLLELSRLSPLVSVSGAGVDPGLVDLTRWVASHWWGPWRAVLTSASAPRSRINAPRPSRGRGQAPGDDAVSVASGVLREDGGGLLVVPPAESALHAVARWAAEGPVVVVCPTVHMAVAGSASLRRRGFTTALVPDDWEKAAGGVDVVIGARSSVFAPCPGLTGVIVIDEHDELLHEERVPNWDATSVAVERARRAGVPFMATSAVPSLRSRKHFEHRTRKTGSASGWPRVSIVDLDDVPVKGSLLSSELLSAVTDESLTTVCVLNVKGKARMIVCKSCRSMQTCADCASLLTQSDDGILTCPRCGHEAGRVCGACGRTSFVVPRAGASHLRTEVEASTGISVVELTSESDDDWTKGRVFIGTEAVLHRVRSADRIVFADIDRDLGAPRMSATQEVLALIARAARIVGPRGSLVVQTRQPAHRLMRALGSDDVAGALDALAGGELASREALELPPFAVVVRVTISDGRDIADAGRFEGVETARDGDGHLLRSTEWGRLDLAIAALRSHFGTAVRVHADPLRY